MILTHFAFLLRFDPAVPPVAAEFPVFVSVMSRFLVSLHQNRNFGERSARLDKDNEF
jgi:hypothetical protein